MYDALKKAEKDKYEKMIMEQRNIAYVNQNKLWNESEEKIRILKHDMKNHIFKIKSLASDGQLPEITEYTHSMLESIQEPYELCDSGNYDLDSIVNLKLSEAHSAGTKIHLDIKVPQKINIDGFDLNRIFSNLFDNAIDAVQKVEKKIIYFQMEYEKGVVNICLRNSYNGQLKFKEKGRLISTKKTDDMKQHGLGLKSIRSTIEKYDGDIDYEYEDNIFSVYIVMYEK